MRPAVKVCGVRRTCRRAPRLRCSRVGGVVQALHEAGDVGSPITFGQRSTGI